MSQPLETEYLIFREAPTEPTRKTKIWDVVSKNHGDVLGAIQWYGAWRQYTFWPAAGTIWNTGCLADIQSFIRTQMELRRSRV